MSEKEREEQIIKYRPIVYWLAKKFNPSQDLYLVLIEEGMTTLISSIDSYTKDKSSTVFLGYLYNKVRNKMLSKMMEMEKPIVNINTAIEINDDWSIDLEDTLKDTLNCDFTQEASPHLGFFFKLKDVFRGARTVKVKR